jgi:Peptidase M15
MANLVLAFAELLGGAIIADAAIKGDSIANVIRGQATNHAVDFTGASPATAAAAGAAGAGATVGAAAAAVGTATPTPLTAAEADLKNFVTGSADVGPGKTTEIAQRLSELGGKLGVKIYAISAYRTPAHSVAVGGFADDPHTKGLAIDIGVNGLMRASATAITNAQLASVGLWRPFDMNGEDANEVNHIQLIGTA